MKTKMKTVRILIPILLLFVLLSAASPVLALDKLTFQYAVTGKIRNVDSGVGAIMSLTLKGTLTLGTANFVSSNWSSWKDEDRGWNNYNGENNWSFPWNDLSSIPQYVINSGFTPEENHQYRAHVAWDTYEHWMDHFQTYSYKWYTPKGSWSGQLVAMWNGGTSPETFSVSLSPWKVEKLLVQGNKYMAGDSWRHEHWEIYWVNTGDGEQQVFNNDYVNKPSGGFNYYLEMLTTSFDGKFSTKNKHLDGRLWLTESKYWQDTVPPSPPSPGVSGNGEFGPYSFQFPS
jgi:hypothetical protein